MRTRVCTKCGEEKPETDEYFYKNKSSRGGINTTCKACHNKNVEKWKAENPEKARETIKRWQAENREKVMETVKRWQAENPEKNREKSRRWYAKNTEKGRESRKRYVDTLAPCYLKQLITLKYNIDSSEIGEELMEAKRREIKYYRQFKQLNQLKK